MAVSLVVTVIGQDRPGLVERLSRMVAHHRGNWEESRMARLGGRFAGILRVTIPDEEAAPLARALCTSEGLQVVVEDAGDAHEQAPRKLLNLDLVGTDRPGIVRELAKIFASRNINVDELVTGVSTAAESGERVFKAHARLWAPASVSSDELLGALEALAQDLMVEVELERL